MTVYVDEIKDWSLIAKARGLRYSHWCHLTADTEEELHAFAAKLGLRRSWFQKKSDRDYRWHYDIVPSKRAQAVRLGAREIDRRGLLPILDARRAALGMEPGTAVVERATSGGPPCGNNPNHRLSPGDQQAVDEFKAHLQQRKGEGR
jgi:hypothetical protein